ncbi:MAG: Diaminopimelate epimerase, partial [Gemmatimonadetes bacterium]|nr:Diaminopimelate epimerase [Gemmatimonadota bacterium]
MTSSPWHAHGNVYLISEDAELTPARVRDEAAGTDGIVQVVRAGDDEAEIVIWNTDGSFAEMSGNGTRIAGAWLMARSGAEQVRIVVGPRVVTVRAL